MAGARSQPDHSAGAKHVDTSARVGVAADALDQRVRAWKVTVGNQRKTLESAHSRYLKQVKTAAKQLKTARKPKRLVGSAFTKVSVFETHLIINGKRFELQSGIQATVDSAGNISRTRRFTLTRTAAFGLGTLFMPKATKHDDRELYLLVESSEWAEVVKLDPKRRREAQQLAQQIVLASSHAEDHQGSFARRLAQAEKALRSAVGALDEIEEAERVLRERDEAERGYLHETRQDLRDALNLVGESTNRNVKYARRLLAEVDTALEVPLALPPRPAAAVTGIWDGDLARTFH